MSDALTAIAGVVLVLIFPVAVIAFYRWQDRDRDQMLRWHEEDQEQVREWEAEQRANIEQRARRGQ